MANESKKLYCYAVRVITGQELKIKRKIEYKLAESSGCPEQWTKLNGLRIDVPTYTGRTKMNKIVNKTLLPGYILVVTSQKINAAIWHFLKVMGGKKILVEAFDPVIIETMLQRAVQIEQTLYEKRRAILEKVRRMKQMALQTMVKRLANSPVEGQEKVVAVNPRKRSKVPVPKLIPLLN